MVNSSSLTNGVKFLRLQWRKLENLSCQAGGAKDIFVKVFREEKAGNTFWLDSSFTEKRRARFSFMRGKGGALWKQITFRLSDPSEATCNGGSHISIEDARGLSTTAFLEDGFFHYMDKELQYIRYNHFTPLNAHRSFNYGLTKIWFFHYEGLPFEFYGGYIGYLGYGLKLECGAPYERIYETLRMLLPYNVFVIL